MYSSSLKCSVADHIHNREMPEGGLQDLVATVKRDLPWAAGLPSTLLEKETHRRLISILVSGMYVLAPQGRIESLTTLTLTAAQTQLQTRGGCALSNTFKTYEKYGYQPISLPNELHPALNALLGHASPYSHRGNSLFCRLRGDRLRFNKARAPGDSVFYVHNEPPLDHHDDPIAMGNHGGQGL